jgi:hypothetical protein
MPSAFLTFSDVAGEPKVRIELPLVRLGDRLELRFNLQRRNAGRTEELRVAGEFRVTSLVLDTTRGVRQLIQVSATGVAPGWRPIKNPPPSRFPVKGLKIPPKD